MLCCVVTTDDTIGHGEGSGECVWVGGVEEVGNVEEGECGLTSLGGEAAMLDTDVALRVGGHGGVPGMPEELDILLICDGFGVEDVLIDF